MVAGGSLRDFADGTRFRVFPQPPFGRRDAVPETIKVSTPPGLIHPGPSDARMFFVRPLGKRAPYGVVDGGRRGPLLTLPPWTGPIAPPVSPGPDGHFDHLTVGTPDFEAAHLFGVAHFVMDVWEIYLGHPVRWHFTADFDRLQLSILPDWANGQIGYGYLEVGQARGPDGEDLSFALNFDVIAHEIGHAIIYAEVGLPAPDAARGEYYGFHESAADWVAMIAALHFPSVVDSLLSSTSGNLYTFNELNRFSEFSRNSQIRLASNYLKLSDFAHGWRDEHRLSQPLTGALFDVFVDIFHEILVDVGAIGRSLEQLSDIALHRPDLEPRLQAEFDAAYARDPEGFAYALVEARDLMGELLVTAWKTLSPDHLGYADFGDALIAADAALTGGRLRDILFENFRWRDIGAAIAGPRLEAPDARSHAFSDRCVVPEEVGGG
jgi:hypothetical protein